MSNKDILIKKRLEDLFIYVLQNKKVKHKKANIIAREYNKFKTKLWVLNVIKYEYTKWNISVRICNYNKVILKDTNQYTEEMFNKAVSIGVSNINTASIQGLKRLYDQAKIELILNGTLPLCAIDWELNCKPQMKII